jgi:hypothetical protein
MTPTQSEMQFKIAKFSSRPASGGTDCDRPRCRGRQALNMPASESVLMDEGNLWTLLFVFLSLPRVLNTA